MPSIDFEQMKHLIPMRDVLRLLGWVPLTSEAGQGRGRCPIHNSTNPRSRSFATKDDGWYCHSCKLGGDQFTLWATCQRLPIYQAVMDLCRELGRSVAYRPRRPRLAKARNGEEAR
jgi:DNA primase